MISFRNLCSLNLHPSQPPTVSFSCIQLTCGKLLVEGGGKLSNNSYRET